MAYLNTSIPAQKKSVLASIGDSVSNFFVNMMDAASRTSEVERMHNMSDRQLADIGLRREDIVRRVFADKIGM